MTEGGVDVDTWTVQCPEMNASRDMEIHLCVDSYDVSNLVSQISSIGICVGHYNANKEWRQLLEYEARILSLFPCLSQEIDSSVPNTSHYRPATQVTKELRNLFAKIFDKGWMIQLYVNDAGREFRLFSNLFTSQGLYRHSEPFNQSLPTKDTGLFQNLILGDRCPLGSGRSITVIDLSQRIRGWCDLLGIPAVSIEIPYQRIFKRQYQDRSLSLTQQASDQAYLWQTLVQAMKGYVDAKKQLEYILAGSKEFEGGQFVIICYVCGRDQFIHFLTPIQVDT